MSDTPLKNRILLDVLNGKPTDRPPVWMMRQAGRYLPEYMELREKYSFFERVKTPELACEITLQPIDIVGVDAAILFSDILVILECLGVEVQLKPGFGPLIPQPIRSKKDMDRIDIKPARESLSYVYDALRVTRQELNGRVPLIGFAGGPWTLFCYLAEGQGSKTFSKAKQFLFSDPVSAHQVLKMLTEQTIEYFHEQVKAGAQVLQVFESWAAALGPDDFVNHAMPYLKEIVDQDYGVPVILFAKDAEWSYRQFQKTNVNGFGISWGCSPEDARSYTGGKVVQGNYDPSKLLSSPKIIEKEVHEMIDRFGADHYIANLGHGILPDVPVDNAKAFVNAVKNYRK
ncbi:uroporphyrinogen decarboxylase [Balneola sp. MJW-20]|uniref:uroporphyrinogen decarboxylase n=1 Tax=Gracilimonas aurantiaca TaxID=3234185 RepID=UPI003467D9F8